MVKAGEVLWATSCCVAVIAAGVYLATNAESQWETIFAGVMIVFSSVFTVVYLDTMSLTPAKSHKNSTMLNQYYKLNIMRFYGRLLYYKHVWKSSRCKKYQQKTMFDILLKNHLTDYGQQHKFLAIGSREDFVTNQPLTDYSHYAEYEERVASREQEVLTLDEVIFLGMTSGITGKNKLYGIPTTVKETYIMKPWLHQSPFILPYISLKRYWQFRLYPPEDWKSPAHVPMGSASTRFWSTQPFNIVPECMKKIPSEYPTYYIQALFVLSEKELAGIEGFSSNLIYAFFKVVENHWEHLCHDIARGRVSKNVDLDPEIREAVNSCLCKDAQRAEDLEEEFKQGMVGIAQRIWPDLTIIQMGNSGSFEHCANLLQQTFLKGVKIANTHYRCTEAGVLGVNLEDDVSSPVYTFLTDAAFLEFIPVEDIDKENPSTLFMEQLEKDHQYEVVVTSYLGLYRYRIGDIIEVVGFQNSTPKFTLMYRSDQVMSLVGERTPENKIYEAIMLWQKQLKASIIEFTATESNTIEKLTGTSQKSPHYVMFIEMEENSNIVLDSTHAAQLDESLCQTHTPYGIARNKDEIGSLQLTQVKPGTMSVMKQHMWGGTTNPDFKMPRVLRRDNLLEVLMIQKVKPGSK